LTLDAFGACYLVCSSVSPGYEHEMDTPADLITAMDQCFAEKLQINRSTAINKILRDLIHALLFKGVLCEMRDLPSFPI
jgi:hypothetical protein